MLFDEAACFGEVVLNRFPRVVIGHWCLVIGHSTEPRSVEMDVGHEQRHQAAGGNLPGFVQVALRAVLACFSAKQTPLPRSREESLGEFVLRAGAAEAGHGGFDIVEQLSQLL